MHLGDDPDDAVAHRGGQHADLLDALDPATRERLVGARAAGSRA